MTALNSEGLEKIKLCPLCRHVAREADPVHSTEGQIDSGYGPLSFGVECGADLECGCKVDGFPDRSSAIAAWNRRALPPVDGLEVVAELNRIIAEEDADFADEAGNAIEAGERPDLWDREVEVAVHTLSQASSVIAGLTAERDAAQASAFVWENRFVLMDGAYNREFSRAQAAEARISSLEKENKRLREAIDAIADFDDPDDSLDPNVIHLIRIAGAARRAARQALEDHNG